MVRFIDPREIITDRPNIEFVVNRKSVGNLWRDLKPWMENVTGSVVIFALRRIETDKIQTVLAQHGIESLKYHAGLPLMDRLEALRKFAENEIKVIVATVAFRKGIDKADIRRVIHYGTSKNFDSYYQEICQAGRDGLPAKVVTFFEEEDFQIYGAHGSSTFRQYLYSTECRRKTILNYFGVDSTSLATRENCCDNCSRAINPLNSSPEESERESSFYEEEYETSFEAEDVAPATQD